MRHSVNPHSDMKFFRNTAKIHREVNLRPRFMRGGIRL